MTTYGVSDITGTNSLWKQVNIPGCFYTTGVKLEFENSPIYADSLVITSADGLQTPLVENTDWEIQSDDIATTAMSRAFLANSNFTGKLIKSITIISTKKLPLNVSMDYQEFYLTVPGRTFDDGTPFEVSVDLIKSLVSGLADMRQQFANVKPVTAGNLNKPALLPLDINMSMSSNAITGETQTINSTSGGVYVRPAMGAFFGTSVSIMAGTKTLTPGVDYINVVVSKLTKQSSAGGIYNFFLITYPYSGQITYNYHAVGGKVQQSDIDATYSLMVAIKELLDNGLFLTKDTVQESPAFLALYARFTKMEDDVRAILSGAPNYGNTSSGQTVIRPIKATDSNLHWYSIASLYQVTGSTDIIQADAFRGRVYLAGSKVSVDFLVDCNLTLTRRPVVFKTLGLITDPMFTLFADLSAAIPVYPEFRVVRNNSASAISGAILQIGLANPSLTDTLVVEDLSSVESCWNLITTGQQITGQEPVDPTGPQDSGFTLPDGVSVWSSDSSISVADTFLPASRGGYLVYAGSGVQITSSLGSTGWTVTNSLPESFPVSLLTALDFTCMSGDNTIPYRCRIPLASIATNTVQGLGTLTLSDGSQFPILVTIVTTSTATTFTVRGLSSSNFPSTMTDTFRYITGVVEE